MYTHCWTVHYRLALVWAALSVRRWGLRKVSVSWSQWDHHHVFMSLMFTLNTRIPVQCLLGACVNWKLKVEVNNEWHGYGGVFMTDAACWDIESLPLVFGKHWLILKSVFKYSRNAGCWFLCIDTSSESIEPLLGGWGVTTPGRGERGGRQAVVSLVTAVNTRQEVKWWLADTEMVVLSPFTLSQWAETWHQWSECLWAQHRQWL